MDTSKWNIDEINALNTVIVIVIAIVVRALIRRSILKFGMKIGFDQARRRLMSRIAGVIVSFITVIVLGMVWGVKREEFTIVLSSVLAVIGVAFFAQWSILSNITSSIILYFSHPVKIGDFIKIHDKDFPVEGTVFDISAFFFYVRMRDGQTMAIPNSILMQKSLSIGKGPSSEDASKQSS